MSGEQERDTHTDNGLPTAPMLTGTHWNSLELAEHSAVGCSICLEQLGGLRSTRVTRNSTCSLVAAGDAVEAVLRSSCDHR